MPPESFRHFFKGKKREKKNGLATDLSWPFPSCWPLLLVPYIRSLLDWYSSHHHKVYLVIPLHLASLSTLVFTPSRWVLCLLTDLNIYTCLWSPVDLLPFPLSFSICSHLLFGCKLAGESNGENSISLAFLREFWYLLSLCWHIYNPQSPASEAQHHPPCRLSATPPSSVHSTKRAMTAKAHLPGNPLVTVSPSLTPLTWA